MTKTAGTIDDSLLLTISNSVNKEPLHDHDFTEGDGYRCHHCDVEADCLMKAIQNYLKVRRCRKQYNNVEEMSND